MIESSFGPPVETPRSTDTSTIHLAHASLFANLVKASGDIKVSSEHINMLTDACRNTSTYTYMKWRETQEVASV
jgi:hypothetical protein